MIQKKKKLADVQAANQTEKTFVCKRHLKSMTDLAPTPFNLLQVTGCSDGPFGTKGEQSLRNVAFFMGRRWLHSRGFFFLLAVPLITPSPSSRLLEMSVRRTKIRVLSHRKIKITLIAFL